MGDGPGRYARSRRGLEFKRHHPVTDVSFRHARTHGRLVSGRQTSHASILTCGSRATHQTNCIPPTHPCKHYAQVEVDAEHPITQPSRTLLQQRGTGKPRGGMRELRRCHEGKKTRSRRGLEFKRHHPVTDVSFRQARTHGRLVSGRQTSHAS